MPSSGISTAGSKRAIDEAANERRMKKRQKKLLIQDSLLLRLMHIFQTCDAEYITEKAIADLVEAGVDLNAFYFEDNLPRRARYYTKSDVREVAEGKPVGLRSVHGHTPLGAAVELHSPGENDMKNVVLWLLQMGADPNRVSSEVEISPLEESISRGDLPMIDLLISNGASVHKFSASRTHTPLHAAVDCCRRDIYDYLLQRGAKSGIRNSNGDTAEELYYRNELSKY